MKSNTKIFDGRPLRLDNVAPGSDRRIRTVAVLNNTPFFLYIGREQNVTRESALFVVEPYTDVIQPVSESQALYVVEGPAIGTVPPNAQATILYGPEIYAHGERRTGRNVVIPIWRGNLGAQPTTAYLTAQDTTTGAGFGGGGGGNLSAQGTGGTVTTPDGQTARVFAVPASARRRTIYATGHATAELQGSIDGAVWVSILTRDTAVIELPDLALPPYLRLKLAGTSGAAASAYMVVDL